MNILAVFSTSIVLLDMTFGHGIYLWQAKHCTSCSTSDCGPQNLRMKHLELAAAVNTQGEIKDLDLSFS